LRVGRSVTSRGQVREAGEGADPRMFYRTAVILSDLSDGPVRSALDANANVHDAAAAHIVVTNIQQLSERDGTWLDRFPADYFDLVLVDEGHHNAAPSCERVFQRFAQARVISVTATPFRADEQPVEGDVIYRYTFRAA